MNDLKKQYVISLEYFQGPLDLLHQLIKKRKLQINTVSLSEITDDYLAYLRRETVSVDEIAHFVSIASVLILIKSKSLLPILEYTKDEEADIMILESRVQLLDYIRRKAVPAFDSFRDCFLVVSPPKQSQRVDFRPDASCVPDVIHANARAVLEGISFLKELPNKKVDAVVSLEEMIERVLKTIAGRAAVSFNDMVSADNKREKIVSFLAVLELMREGFLTATQEEQFVDITLLRQHNRI